MSAACPVVVVHLPPLPYQMLHPLLILQFCSLSLRLLKLIYFTYVFHYLVYCPLTPVFPNSKTTSQKSSKIPKKSMHLSFHKNSKIHMKE
jgi:hypothetical protein